MKLEPNGASEIVGVQIAVTFDASALEVIGIEHITDTLPIGVGPIIDNTEGTVRFAAFTMAPLGSGQGPFDFATITFRAKSASEGTEVRFEVGAGKTSVADTSGRELLRNMADFLGAWIKVT